MKVQTVDSSELVSSSRLDAYFHLSAGRKLSRHVGRTEIRHLRLGDRNAVGAAIWAPGRFKRVYAGVGETHLPYLRPSDTLNFIPLAADHLSATRSANIDTYRLKKGTILVTCSGRNLGPVAYVDAFLERFVLSHDMIRVGIEDEDLRFYTLAVLGAPTGQLLLRKDKSGSVIDHITTQHVASIDLPILSNAIFKQLVQSLRNACELRETARLALDELRVAYEASLPAIECDVAVPRHWAMHATDLLGRLDAAPYETIVRETRAALRQAGGRRLGELATALKPTGRYKTLYVDREHGVPILSGGQLLQTRPLNPRFMAPRALRDIDRYRLRSGWIAYQADGRSEEALGEPVMITSARDDWLASGHVGRIVANNRDDAGRLFLAFQTPHAQLQLKALASGSVVDATFPADAEAVILPPLPDAPGPEIEGLWEQFAEAERLENHAYALIEQNLTIAWQ